MTLHAIEGHIAPDSGMTESSVQTEVDDWVSKRKSVIQADYDGSVRRRDTAMDGSGSGTEYLFVGIRFTSESDTKDNLLQKFGDKFANKVAWFVIVWHECDHDESDRPGCPRVWDEKRKWEAKDVTVPAAIDASIPGAETVVQHE